MGTEKKLVVVREQPTLVIAVTEDVGSLEGPSLAGDLAEVMRVLESRERPRVVVDFRDHEYFGSAMLETLLRIWRAVRDRSGRIAVCGVSRFGHELLGVSHFDKLIAVHGSLDEAERSVHGSE